MTGFFIRVRFAKGLRVSRGRLTEGLGTGVHAATFLRQHLVILDCELMESPTELKRIWLHELFHFVWWRLGNRTRLSWEKVLVTECARGELGWSAQWRKNALTRQDRGFRTRRWREYCAESFCDTGAWVAAEMPRHPEATLSLRAKRQRVRWWRQSIRYTPGVGI